MHCSSGMESSLHTDSKLVILFEHQKMSQPDSCLSVRSDVHSRWRRSTVAGATDEDTNAPKVLGRPDAPARGGGGGGCVGGDPGVVVKHSVAEVPSYQRWQIPEASSMWMLAWPSLLS
ncbi:hypothetical protein Tco_0438380 [Tanacetum coccineum]